MSWRHLPNIGGLRGRNGQSEAAALDGDSWQVWKPTLITLAIGLIVLIGIFRGTSFVIVNTWWTNDAFNHGFFIVPISVYLIWRARHSLARLRPEPTMWGIAAIAAASFAWLLGDVAAVLIVEQLAFVGIIQGFVLSVVGWRVFRTMLFPMGFLFFGVPMGGFLIPPLQDFTAQFTVMALQLTGVPVFLEGLYIQIPGGAFEVAAACAGARFLISSVTLGALVAKQFYRQTWRRVLFLALSVVVPIVANGFRAYGLVMIAHLSGFELAVGADHLTFGLIFLSFVVICLLAVGYTFRESRDEDEPTSMRATALAGTKSVATIAIIGTALGAAFVAGAAATYASSVANKTNMITEVNLLPPEAGAGWHRTADQQSGWRPKFYGAVDERVWGYANGDEKVEVYTAYYTDQKQDTEVIGWRNRLSDGEVWVAITTPDSTTSLIEGEMRDVGRIHLSRALLSGSEQRRVVLFWYWVDGRFTANPQLAKLYEIKSKLLGGVQSAAVIALASNYRDTPDEAMKKLQNFLTETSSFKHMLEHAAIPRKPSDAIIKSELCLGGASCAE